RFARRKICGRAMANVTGGSLIVAAWLLPAKRVAGKAPGYRLEWSRMTQRGRAQIVGACLLGLALLIGARAALDRYQQIGRPFPGFMVMDNLLVAVGGGERGGFEPFDWVRAVNGQFLRSGGELQAEVARHPIGTRFHY